MVTVEECWGCFVYDVAVLDCYFCHRIRCEFCVSSTEGIGQVCRECMALGRGQPKPEEEKK